MKFLYSKVLVILVVVIYFRLYYNILREVFFIMVLFKSGIVFGFLVDRRVEIFFKKYMKG